MSDEPDQRSPWDPPAEGSQPEQPGPASPHYGYGAPTGGAYGQQPPYPPPMPPPPYGQTPAYGYPPPTGGYGPAPYYGPTTSGKATTVLVLGIVALVLTLSCIGFIPAIVALVMAPAARREITSSGGRLTGESQLKAGKIMSWIALALTALVIVVAVLGVVIAVSNDGSSGDPPSGPFRTNATSLIPVAPSGSGLGCQGVGPGCF